MAEELIAKPRHGLVKVILERSTVAKKLAVAMIAGSPKKVHLTHALVDGDDADGKEKPGRGPDDGPMDRENREIIPTPHFG
jgi:hypothetical protein